jgi:hypothetical protein
MRRFGMISLMVVAGLWLMPDSGVAQNDYHEIAPGLTWGGSYRGRGEIKNNYKFGVNQPGNKQSYSLGQFRLNLKWNPVDEVTFFVEGQDARMASETSTDDNARPSIYADNLDVHQAYVDINFPAEYMPVALKIGRQKLNLGDQRMVASLEWVNTARVWDAVQMTFGTPGERTVQAFISHLVPVTPHGWNDWYDTGNRMWDSYLHGIYYTDAVSLVNSQWEAYYLYREEDRHRQPDQTHSFGLRIQTQQGNLDADGEIVGQLGTFAALDHRALALHLGAGYTVNPDANGRIGAAYNYATGDDDKTDGTHGTFDNLYPLNHAYYGYMDFFSWQNMHNIEFTYSQVLLNDFTLRVAYQGFWLAQSENDNWYNAGGGVVRNANNVIRPDGSVLIDSKVGDELDITVAFPLWERVSGVVGWSHFWTGDYVSATSTHTKDADFLFGMAKIAF